MKLELSVPAYYRVKKGQTLFEIAETFLLPPCVLARCNHLLGEPSEGQVLMLPPRQGSLYLVKGGESKTLLCGSPEKFRELNLTDAFYPAQIIRIPV